MFSLQMWSRVFTIIAIFLSSSSGSPLHPRVETFGPEGSMTYLSRWRDALGTATQVWAQGPGAAFRAIHVLRSGPLSSVFRKTLPEAGSEPCHPEDDHKCEIAINGFGTIGEVQYTFNSSKQNTQGRSTQVMVACRCLGKECGEAVLIRPVSILTLDSSGNKVDTGKRTCLYETVRDKFSECSSELLRVSRRPKAARPGYFNAGKNFHYTVNSTDYWDAIGQRGWLRYCLDTEIAQLRSVDILSLKPSQLYDEKQQRVDPKPLSHSCTGVGDAEYLRASDDNEGHACAEVYQFAAASAAHQATQEDEIATGNVESTYMHPKPPLVTDTELALTCSAAGLGVLFLWSMRRKLLKKTHATPGLVAKHVITQILSYALEALPLHTALGSELRARDWATLFAFTDGTLALGKGFEKPLGSAKGSVLVVTSVLGEVRYKHTREALVATLAVVFDLAAMGIVANTIVTKAMRMRSNSRKKIYGVRECSRTHGWSGGLGWVRGVHTDVIRSRRGGCKGSCAEKSKKGGEEDTSSGSSGTLSSVDDVSGLIKEMSAKEVCAADSEDWERTLESLSRHSSVEQDDIARDGALRHSCDVDVAD